MKLLLTVCYVVALAGCADPRPYIERSPAPKPRSTPAATALSLYSTDAFFGVRGPISKSIIDYLSPCFSPGLESHLNHSLLSIDRWKELHREESLKLPLPEGPTFADSYESPHYFRIGAERLDGDRATVEIHLKYSRFHRESWMNTAHFVHVNGRWLLDDIHFRSSQTLRTRTTLME